MSNSTYKTPPNEIKWHMILVNSIGMRRFLAGIGSFTVISFVKPYPCSENDFLSFLKKSFSLVYIVKSISIIKSSAKASISNFSGNVLFTVLFNSLT